MNEDFVPFNLAVKLKEKGFREKCLRYYDTEDDDRNFLYWNANEADIHYYFYHSWNTRCEGYNYIRFDAPTIPQVLKWLREKKGILIAIDVFKDYTTELVWWGYNIVLIDKYESCYHCRNFDNYEQSAIAGIEYTLDNLI